VDSLYKYVLASDPAGAATPPGTLAGGVVVVVAVVVEVVVVWDSAVGLPDVSGKVLSAYAAIE
jgi:hypothetical protein